MQKLKEYKYFVLIVFLLLSVAFYWYYWKPNNQIKKIIADCVRDSENKTKTAEMIAEQNNKPFMYGKYYDEQLYNCVSKKGLLKYWDENLIQQHLLR